jgi:hypothetical protein
MRISALPFHKGAFCCRALFSRPILIEELFMIISGLQAILHFLFLGAYASSLSRLWPLDRRGRIRYRWVGRRRLNNTWMSGAWLFLQLWI